MEKLPTLPYDIIRLIIKTAQLDIDTRIGLRVKPGRLIGPSYAMYDAVREQLMAMHVRRARLWNRHKLCSIGALDYISSPDIILGPHTRMYISIRVYTSYDDVRMSIEAHRISDDPDGPYTPADDDEDHLGRRRTCCVLNAL